MSASMACAFTAMAMCATSMRASAMRHGLPSTMRCSTTTTGPGAGAGLRPGFVSAGATGAGNAGCTGTSIRTSGGTGGSRKGCSRSGGSCDGESCNGGCCNGGGRCSGPPGGGRMPPGPPGPPPPRGPGRSPAWASIPSPLPGLSAATASEKMDSVDEVLPAGKRDVGQGNAAGLHVAGQWLLWYTVSPASVCNSNTTSRVSRSPRPLVRRSSSACPSAALRSRVTLRSA